MLVSDFDYVLPSGAIAQTPVQPRDSSRLLDVSTGADHPFTALPDLLNPGDLVVVNDTRVRAARLRGVRAEGGNVEVLLLERAPDGEWTALARPARRLRPGSRLIFDDLEIVVTRRPDQGVLGLRLEVGNETEEEAAIARLGEMPLPPYITEPLGDGGRYQTIFASRTGSAAAPTAGLHFTPTLTEALVKREVELATVELRVGLDTFRPMTAERVDDHVIHAEWIEIPEATTAAVERVRARSGAVVAVGTTVVRALESRSRVGGAVEPGSATTDLFIRPGFEFRVVDRLITNFHQPRSSLLVMVAAFMGDGWRRVYDTALSRGMRFLSFGDAMLADRQM